MVEIDFSPSNEDFSQSSRATTETVSPPWVGIEAHLAYENCLVDPYWAFRQFREALCTGEVTAYLVERDGSIISVPSEFWLSDLADREFDHAGTTAVPVAERTVTGRLFVDRRELEALWSETGDLGSGSLDYIPPYLAFMVKAAAALQLSEEKRLPKSEIAHWLEENWPSELGEALKEKIAYMATFLRHPDDQRGGYYTSKRLTKGGRPKDSLLGG